MGGSQSKSEENESHSSMRLVNIEENGTVATHSKKLKDVPAQLADKSLIEVSIFNIFVSHQGNK